MGLIENLGAVASSYMDEKDKLQSAEERRKRTRAGHGFWPHEALRDTLIFAFMLCVLLFTAMVLPLFAFKNNNELMRPRLWSR